MKCNCKWCEAILSILIIIFALVETASSKWIIFAAAVILLIHAIFCHKGNCCEAESKSKKKR
jgi:hypothetical protein